MGIYAISDLHLALGVEKPMDVFGGRWENYMDKLKENWNKTVSVDDYVIVPGDISWATYLEQAYEDFKFIDALPGIKIISKGNHDYWWTTLSKLEKFINDNGIGSVHFLHNSSYIINRTAICGTRGWLCPGADSFSSEDEKIYQRELIRFELSLKSLKKGSYDRIIAAFHYPPLNKDDRMSEFVKKMTRHGVETCIYGHLHGEAQNKAVMGKFMDIDFRLVSADYLNFTPVFLQ
jgi:uncharacterized protein